MEENDCEHSGLIENDLQNVYADEQIRQNYPSNQLQENGGTNKQMEEMTRSLAMLGNTISDLNNQFQNKMGSLEKDLYEVKSKISLIQNPDSEVQFNFNTNENRDLEQNTTPTIVPVSPNRNRPIQNSFGQDLSTTESRSEGNKPNNLKNM